MPVAAPPDGGAAPTHAGKPGHNGAAGTDAFASLFAQLQADDAAAQGGAGSADGAAAPSQQDTDAAAFLRAFQGADALGGGQAATTSNVVDLVAWLKSNAGRRFSNRAGARADETDGAATSTVAKAKSKTDAPNNAATAPVDLSLPVTAAPTAVPVIPVVPGGDASPSADATTDNAPPLSDAGQTGPVLPAVA